MTARRNAFILYKTNLSGIIFTLSGIIINTIRRLIGRCNRYFRRWLYFNPSGFRYDPVLASPSSETFLIINVYKGEGEHRDCLHPVSFWSFRNPYRFQNSRYQTGPCIGCTRPGRGAGDVDRQAVAFTIKNDNILLKSQKDTMWLIINWLIK